MKSSFWNKKASDMTIDDTMKFTGIMSVASLAICLVPLAIEYKDEIADLFSAKFKRKEAKPALSNEEEEDWGV